MIAAQDANLLLDVRNINVDYYASNGAVHAVRDVSLTLKRGEILGLAGESGSGKSTLAYAIARLLRPPAAITGGEVLYYPNYASTEHLSTFASLMESASIKKLKTTKGRTAQAPDTAHEGVDVLTLTPAQLRVFRWNELSIVFQSAMNALNPVMTVGKQIMDVIAAHQPSKSAQERQRRAEELLQMVGIAADRLQSYPHELSGGMRQRVIIAIALALDPEVIIMDEPTTALDVVVQREILDLISKLCKKTGTALIFITHDLSLLLELADRVAVMYAGKLVEVSDREHFYESPRHPYSYGLMNSFPTLHGPRRKMLGIPGSPPDLRHVPSGCPFHQRCPFAFEDCRKVVPQLRQVFDGAPQPVVACHLYDTDRTKAQAIPTPADLARGYELTSEERSAIQ